MDPWLLRLSPPQRERAFWQDPGTLRSLVWLDRLGLLLGVCTNASMAWRTSGRVPRHMLALLLATTALQALQAAWLLLSQRTYLRHRTAVTYAQRLRWLISTSIGLLLPTTQVLAFFAMDVRRHGGNLRGLLTLLGAGCIPSLLCNSNHPLDFRGALAVNALALPVYALLLLPQQMAALQLLDLQKWVQPVCQAVQDALMVPLRQTLLPGARACAGPAAASFLFTYVHLATIGASLFIGYVHKRAAKVAWLKMGGVRAGGHVTPLLAVLYAWGGCTAAWMLLAVVWAW